MSIPAHLARWRARWLPQGLAAAAHWPHLMRPGVRLMRNLSMPHKAALLGTVVLVAFAALLTLVVQDSLQQHARRQQTRQALQKMAAVADLNSAVLRLSRSVFMLEALGRADQLAEAAAAEQASFGRVEALVRAADAPDAAGFDRVRQQHQALRTLLAQPAQADPLAMAAAAAAADATRSAALSPRLLALRAYARELEQLRRGSAADWDIVAEGEDGNRWLYDGSVQFAFQALPSLFVVQGAGRRLLLAPQLGQAGHGPVHQAMVDGLAGLKVTLDLATLPLERSRLQGLLPTADVTQTLEAVQAHVARSERVLRQASAPAAGADAAAAHDDPGGAAFAASGSLAVDRLLALQARGLQTLEARLTREHRAAELRAGVVAAVVTLCLLLTAYLMASVFMVMNKGMATLCGLIERMGRGDLSLPPRPLGRDEIGQAIAMMTDAMASLRRLFDAVTQGVAAVSYASREVAQGNSGLSDRTGTMRDAIGDVAGSAQESATVMDACAQAVESASDHVRGASENARRSSKAMGRLQDRMRTLEACSRDINQLVTVMETIAFQTKLLSLNASVEAARAGVAGKGFAVVATEVRALAGRSEQAAAQIREIVGNSVREIQEGTRLAAQATEAVLRTDQEIRAVTGMTRDVVRLTRDGMSQSQQVLDIARKVEASVSENVQLIDQLSTAAVALRGQGDSLKRSVGSFVLS